MVLRVVPRLPLKNADWTQVFISMRNTAGLTLFLTRGSGPGSLSEIHNCYTKENRLHPLFCISSSMSSQILQLVRIFPVVLHG